MVWGYPWSSTVEVNGIREQPRRIEAVRRTRLRWNYALSRTPEGGRRATHVGVAVVRQLAMWQGLDALAAD